MLYTLPANTIGFLRSCWEESATIPVRKNVKTDAVPVSGQAIFLRDTAKGLFFIHEKLNEVEMKAYFDLLYQAGSQKCGLCR